MTDMELISAYLDNADQRAFEHLLARYLDLSKKIVRKHCRSTLDHEDLVQQSWIKIIQSLSAYDDRQKFGAFVAAVTKNTVRDYWRYQNVRSETDLFTDIGNEEQAVDFPCRQIDADRGFDVDNQFAALMNDYIPNLPVDLRVVFLLKHEAEYWDGKRRLSWTELGKLTAQSDLEAWTKFDVARRACVSTFDGEASASSTIMPIVRETFLVWTQAQRPIGAKRVTENDLSALLGISVNTFKTRYRAAKKQLRESLERKHGSAITT